jgi:YfiR/HmsC-like
MMFLAAAASASQAPSLQDQVKAAYLLNFTRFVEWPGRAFTHAGEPFTICLTSEPVSAALERRVQGENRQGRPLVVRRLPDLEDIQGCHILYLPDADDSRIDRMIRAAGSAPILTVGESPNFIRRGGIIRFVEAGRRIRFEINPDSAQRASLTISSRLLRLAEIVRPHHRKRGRK